ncbi:MAG TPA: hypothetical protein VHZ98_07325 [Galbitalea sp.]|jgi:hypothetical protein|nr:hypothetical protein [Galbitalea sp.]
MTKTELGEVNRRFRPAIGRSVPVSIVRLGIAVVLLTLCFGIIGFNLYLPFGLLLAVMTLAFPKTPAAWGLAILLVALTLGSYNAAPTWQFFVVLAGAHALHQFGMMLAWLPVSGRIQLRILGRMLRSYLIIQIPAQLISLVVLTLLSGTSVVATLTSPLFGVVAGVGLLLLVILVLVPILRAGADEPE